MSDFSPLYLSLVIAASRRESADKGKMARANAYLATEAHGKETGDAFQSSKQLQPRALPQNSYPGTTPREIKIYNTHPQAKAILSTTPVLQAILRGTGGRGGS